MNESSPFAERSDQPCRFTGRLLQWACEGLALAGGLILLLLMGLSLASLLGRKLFATPVQGDIELMEIGMAVAVAAFLPLCELHGKHIRVESFTLRLSARGRCLLDACAHGLCLLAALLLAWRTSLQAWDNFRYGDVSILLSIPLWIPLLLIVPSLLLLALASAWQVGRHWAASRAAPEP
ncbi:TRAP-type C4-dicarboxylate transport system, small permease component [Geopseudomonas sagittaria]|uniref:TRAP transporter small permease protein n=1 Tax=Geopseudomonas sagittaria TaxID=1135990 RepID=A0A1I5ZBB0_9GAMM|nr:TRAP transporter small permease [Pseudomonas sagittaria]SFQ53769.1 TRAP-type C4-dicarboxylate transport system, small permease component [Pseudomonas sagittaria]